MPALEPRRLLILGGTGEAAALASAAIRRFGDGLRVTTSLAGRTGAPAALAGAVRRGGFGGADGLAAYLAAEGIDLVVDATHPFAAAISAAARLACARQGVPRLLLLRPPWRQDPLDRWIEAADAAAAARVLPLHGRRALMTIGAGELAAFAQVEGVHFVVRLVDKPAAPLPLGPAEFLLGRGPFALDAERAILERHAIDVLVAKASGGAATEAKLVAARERRLPVIMLRRPPAEPGPSVADVAGALDWLAARLLLPCARSNEETLP
jgi:precorrin-6A/cobalt-precorrin-6A reductase